jgi:short-subunit dehydrogenase
MRGFAHAVHEDLRDTGVGSTVILPGFIDEAGMWADGGLKTPPGSGGKTPKDVADAVLKAIDKNPHEIVVSGLIPRSGGWLYGFAPSLVHAMQRGGGGEKTASDLAEAQKAKR